MAARPSEERRPASNGFRGLLARQEHCVPCRASLSRGRYLIERPAAKGQTFYGARYASLLARLGKLMPMLAVRAHQLRKVIESPWERLEKHAPAPTDNGRVPEVIIAVCRQ